jgi:hypothetical protein
LGGPNDYSPVGDVWFDETKHLLSGLCDANKDAVVDLEETEELEDLSWLGGDLGDTVWAEVKVNPGETISVYSILVSRRTGWTGRGHTPLTP